MTDSNVQTAENIDIGAKLERLAENFTKLSDQLAKFSGAVVSTLSGQPQVAPRRRGRPPKALAVPVVKPTAVAREMHPIARQALALIEKGGRVSQTDLATELNIERSAVEYHTNQLLADGKIVKRTVLPGGVKTILFYRKDWASFKGE